VKIYIYGLYDPRTGECRYIGKTIHPEVRLRDHRRETGKTKKHGWVHDLKKAGLYPTMKILETFESFSNDDWIELEKKWISEMIGVGMSLLNLNAGGAGPTSCSIETRRKMSESKRGKKRSTPSPMKGRKLSKEHAEKVAAAHRGMKRSAESRARMSARQIGRKASPETRAKMRAARLGRKMPPVSQKERERRRIAQTGKHPSLASRQKMRESQTGRKHSPETLLKMSESARGRIAITDSDGNKRWIKPDSAIVTSSALD
jgi:group I intron endonuclease